MKECKPLLHEILKMRTQTASERRILRLLAGNVAFLRRGTARCPGVPPLLWQNGAFRRPEDQSPRSIKDHDTAVARKGTGAQGQGEEVGVAGLEVEHVVEPARRQQRVDAADVTGQVGAVGLR